MYRLNSCQKEKKNERSAVRSLHLTINDYNNIISNRRCDILTISKAIWVVNYPREGYKTRYISNHGIRTPSECINQRYLKIWADAAEKICFGRT